MSTEGSIPSGAYLYVALKGFSFAAYSVAPKSMEQCKRNGGS